MSCDLIAFFGVIVLRELAGRPAKQRQHRTLIYAIYLNQNGILFSV